jgi:pyrroloquinoline quinone (PQQ) biosynthesis protein C
MMEKFYASKETCQQAATSLNLLRNGVSALKDKAERFHEEADEVLQSMQEDFDFLHKFLEAAHKRLPMHSSYVRAEQNRRKRAKEKANG